LEDVNDRQAFLTCQPHFSPILISQNLRGANLSYPNL